MNSCHSAIEQGYPVLGHEMACAGRHGATLPFTGSNLAVIATIALVLILLGVTLYKAARSG